VTVTVRGARAGDHLVLNQNFDSGWSVDRVPAVSVGDAVAAVLTGDVETVRFRYRPRTWALSLVLFAATALSIATAFGWRRRVALLALPVACLGCSADPPTHVSEDVDIPSASGSAATDAGRSQADFPTAQRDLRITPLEHAGLVLGWRDEALYFDPIYGSPPPFTAPEAPPALDDATLPRADAVFITDAHSDHLDPLALARLHGHAVIVGPPAVAERTNVDLVIREGDTRVVVGVSVTAIPMYNVSRGPAPGVVFHPRGRGYGYLLDLGGTRVYVSGDTDCTPDVRALRNVAVAILAIDGRITMSPAEAAACALAMHPRAVIPYHDWGADLGELRRALDGSGIELRELPFYPRPERLRAGAMHACDDRHWGRCIELLDLAQQLDPRTDEDPRVVQAREQARAGLDTVPLLR
jgi:L-ascorbate metabolism protein UlaG (beta-lactamase superfamily)